MTEANSKTSETHEAKHDSSFVKDQSFLFDLARLKELGGYEAGDLLAVDPELYEKFMVHLNRTVKRDVVTKNIVFLTGLSAFTNDPINLFLRGESSIGKTYNVIEVLKYFPKENVWLLGGLSPTALVHDRGKLIDENGEEIEIEKKPVKPHKTEYQSERDYGQALQEYKEQKKTWIKRLKNSRYLVDLSGKILVFLEAPYIETFNRLRPILSHDTFQISYKFTDKTVRGLQTQHVVIQGFPACIFCSTSEKYVQDLATRSFTVTPEITEEKYHDANVLTGTKAAFPWKFERDFDLDLLEGYIRFLRNNLSDFNVVVPYGEVFAEKFPSRFPRSMRDFKHVLNLVKVSTLFHVAQRPLLMQKVEDKEQRYVMAVREDYEFVIGLWREIRETTETSGPGQIMKFFHEVVEKISEDYPVFHVKDLVDMWNNNFKQKKSDGTIRGWIAFLCDVGYMTKDADPNDKRRNLLSVIKEKNTEYAESQFCVFFTLDLFKAWLKQTKQIFRKNNLKLKENFIMNGEASCDDIFQKFYLNKSDNFRNIIVGDSKPSLSESGEEKAQIQQITQFVNFKAFNVSDISKLERLTVNIQNKCIECGFSGRMGWQVTLYDGSWGMLCEKCGDRLADKMRDEKTRDDSPQQKPTGAVQCLICAKFNKPMFFANQHDLDLHLMRLHSGYSAQQVKVDDSPATETAPEVKPEFSDEKVVSVGDLDPASDQRKCARCHKPKTLPKYAEYSDGAWAPICEECAEALNEKLQKKPVQTNIPTSGDMLQALRKRFSQGFVETECLEFTVNHSWTKEQAESFLNKLEKEGTIFKTPGGLWLWS